MSKNIQRPPTSAPKPGRVDRKIGQRKAQTAAASSSVRQVKKQEKVKAPTPPKPKVSSKKHIEAERALEEAVADRAREDALQEDLEDAQHLAHLGRHVHLEADEELEELEREEKIHDTGATGDDAIKRSQGDSGGQNDGFGGRERGREAYERYLRGNVSADAERIDELKRKGARDDFNPSRTPIEVEALGSQRASAHVVRLYETWTLAGIPRDEAIDRAAAFIAGFNSAQNIRRVLAELESKPIRDVYPLEVLMKMLAARPELLPGVRTGSVIGNADDLKAPGKVLAGVPFTVTVPNDVRVKAFALLGGERPGYEFHPHHKDEGKYQILVDTPGSWTMSVLAAPLQELGRIKRETNEGIIEIFNVLVYAMGKKGEPLTPEQWRALEAERDDGDEDDGAGDEDDAHNDDGADANVVTMPKLAVQLQRQLELIRRDEGAPTTTATATTYSWDASFFKPGAAVGGDAILHVVVDHAGPFDPAWQRAREAIAGKQREYEPGRAVVTADDFVAALRRARVR